MFGQGVLPYFQGPLKRNRHVDDVRYAENVTQRTCNSQLGAVLGQILTDSLNKRRRRKFLAGSGDGLPPEIFWSFTPKSPFLCFGVIQTGYWPNFNLESVLLIKILLLLKNVSHFHKTVETGVDPRPSVASHWKLFTPFESDNFMKKILQPTTT